VTVSNKQDPAKIVIFSMCISLPLERGGSTFVSCGRSRLKVPSHGRQLREVFNAHDGDGMGRMLTS